MRTTAKICARANEDERGHHWFVTARWRAIVLTEPPSLDAGEITDKGSLNSRGIRDRRSAVVDRLYDGAADILLI